MTSFDFDRHMRLIFSIGTRSSSSSRISYAMFIEPQITRVSLGFSGYILSISLYLKEFVYRHSNKLLSSLFSKKHFYPPMNDLNNFSPISNLNFISKILEKVVASRIQYHLSSNALYSSFQSAYRVFHSTYSFSKIVQDSEFKSGS